MHILRYDYGPSSAMIIIVRKKVLILIIFYLLYKIRVMHCFKVVIVLIFKTFLLE